MFRSIVPLDLGGDVARLLRLLELVEGRGVMHTQVVHDHDDLLDVKVHLVDQLALRIASYAGVRIIGPGTARIDGWASNHGGERLNDPE